MRGKRPNGKNLPWRRCRRAAPEEVPNGFSVYRRFALGATAPVPDQIAVAEPGGAGGGAAVGAHPDPAPVCPGTRSGAAADGLDLAPRPLPLPVGDAAGWRPGGAVGLLPGPGRTGRQRRPAGVRGSGPHPTARLAAAPPPLHPDWRPRLWQPGPIGLPPAPG